MSLNSFQSYVLMMRSAVRTNNGKHSPDNVQAHLIACVHVAEKRLELGSTRNAHVKGLCSDKCLGLKQVEVVAVTKVTHELGRKPEERGGQEL